MLFKPITTNDSQEYHRTPQQFSDIPNDKTNINMPMIKIYGKA